ncbi:MULTISPECIES: hypothetical protein [Dehalococcoides]|uniref:Uncharacterized protein n=1 Tax=Dehalococcoides mccartyi TaxID=61435 RepID=A0AB38Z7T3_9CHLR|nr:hypothetical protein [Dehalococcoides mccartyi]WRO06646.1 hypothetical protein VLL09_04455 [Dehalococcoides mccartyi]
MSTRTFITIAGFLTAFQTLWVSTWSNISLSNIGTIWTYISILVSILAIAYVVIRSLLSNNRVEYIPDNTAWGFLIVSGLMTLLNIEQTVITQISKHIDGIPYSAYGCHHQSEIAFVNTNQFLEKILNICSSSNQSSNSLSSWADFIFIGIGLLLLIFSTIIFLCCRRKTWWINHPNRIFLVFLTIPVGFAAILIFAHFWE